MLAMAGAGLLGSAEASCELLVQLDRSQVDAGAETGCAICASGADGAEDASAGTDTATLDVGVEASGPDSEADGGD
jgi:hypothetical protein